MIEFKNVSKTFKTDFWKPKFVALNNISFQLEEGAITGFLGANGAGKTTSLKILMDFIRRDSGEIIFDSCLGRNKKEILSNIGFLPERPYFYPYLTGREFLQYMGKLNNVEKETLIKRIDNLSKQLKINFALDRTIRGYSKGMLQRLGFVSSLLHDPKLLILDEPLSGLDPLGRKDIKDALIKLSGQGKTIFFSSHIVSDMEEVCSNVIVIEEGTLLYQGKIDELLAKKAIDSFTVNVSGLNKCDVPDYATIKYIRDDYISIEVNSKNKKELVKHCVENQLDIIGLSAHKPTLEEVIYRI